MNQFINNISIRLSLLKSLNEDTLPTQIVVFLTEVNQEEIIINRTFENSLSKIVQSLFMHLSEIQSKLIVIHETYFGITMRDIFKTIRLWTKTKVDDMLKEGNKKQLETKQMKIAKLIDSIYLKHTKTFENQIQFQLTAVKNLHKPR